MSVAVQSMKCIWSRSTFLWLVNISLECYRRTVQGMYPILSFIFLLFSTSKICFMGWSNYNRRKPLNVFVLSRFISCSFPSSDRIEQYDTVFWWPKIMTAPQSLCKLASLCQSSYLLLPFVSDCLSFVCKMLFCSTIAICWLLFSLLIHLGLFWFMIAIYSEPLIQCLQTVVRWLLILFFTFKRFSLFHFKM